jgi:hypothetical protein
MLLLVLLVLLEGKVGLREVGGRKGTREGCCKEG